MVVKFSVSLSQDAYDWLEQIKTDNHSCSRSQVISDLIWYYVDSNQSKGVRANAAETEQAQGFIEQPT